MALTIGEIQAALRKPVVQGEPDSAARRQARDEALGVMAGNVPEISDNTGAIEAIEAVTAAVEDVLTELQAQTVILTAMAASLVTIAENTTPPEE